MLKYGICFYTTLEVKNYSSTPPNTAYFFSYPTILSSVPTPVINNDRSLIQGHRHDEVGWLVPFHAASIPQVLPPGTHLQRIDSGHLNYDRGAGMLAPIFHRAAEHS